MAALSLRGGKVLKRRPRPRLTELGLHIKYRRWRRRAGFYVLVRTVWPIVCTCSFELLAGLVLVLDTLCMSAMVVILVGS